MLLPHPQPPAPALPPPATCRHDVHGARVHPIVRRLAPLSTLYGSGALTLDSKALRKQADAVQLRSAKLERVDISRRGSRLGQTHPIGGFVGAAEYSGDLTPFIRLLEAASFTGGGRHTVWGNGEISTERLA